MHEVGFMNWFEYIAPFFNWLGLTIPDLSLVVSIMCGLLFGKSVV